MSRQTIRIRNLTELSMADAIGLPLRITKHPMDNDRPATQMEALEMIQTGTAEIVADLLAVFNPNTKPNQTSK